MQKYKKESNYARDLGIQINENEKFLKVEKMITKKSRQKPRLFRLVIGLPEGSCRCGRKGGPDRPEARPYNFSC